MMRNKIIRAFVVVWCAVCLSYVGVRTAVAAFTDSVAAASQDGEVASSTTDQVKVTEQTEQVKPTEQVPSTQQTTSDSSAHRESEAQTKPNDPSASTEQVTQVEQVTQEEQIEPETEDTVQEEQAGEEAEDVVQEEQAAYVPSLSEYLSGFTCGNCRRNCSLDHPRCHNGSRLAEAKAEEYYSLYG